MALTLALLSPKAASGQTQRPDTVHDRNNCRLAEQVLTQGTPANKRSWALATIVRCGTTATRVALVLADRLPTAAPRDAEEFIGAVSILRDRELAAKALSIAANSAYPIEVRLYGFRILYSQAVPGALATNGSATAAPIVVDSTDTSVTARIPAPPSINEHVYLYGAEIPLGDLERIEASVGSLIAAEQNPVLVRRAASVVLAAVSSAVDRRMGCSSGTREPCGRRDRISNP